MLEFRRLLREGLEEGDFLRRCVTIVHLDLVSQALGFLGVLWVGTKFSGIYPYVNSVLSTVANEKF